MFVLPLDLLPELSDLTKTLHPPILEVKKHSCTNAAKEGGHAEWSCPKLAKLVQEAGTPQKAAAPAAPE